MSIINIRSCDSCGVIENEVEVEKMPPIFDGKEYDGHRNEDKQLSIDLCVNCKKKFNFVLSRVVDEYNADAQKTVNKDQALRIIYRLIGTGRIQLK